ncbi:MAG TPA: response regulator [Chloroflexaceae bacterium]|nr:response regulator [Chloroflexaceae bacterium]
MSRPSRTVLVIDDDPAILRTVADILGDEGYDVVTAANGAEGLELLETVAPGLILLDMRMPVLDGWQFARSLDPGKRAIPLVVMTAAQDARQWAREIGASGYVAKPFDLVELLETVERQLDGQGP